MQRINMNEHAPTYSAVIAALAEIQIQRVTSQSRFCLYFWRAM